MDSSDIKLIASLVAIGFIGKQTWKFIKNRRSDEEINEAIFTRVENMKFHSKFFKTMEFRPNPAMRAGEILVNLFQRSKKSIDVAVYHLSVKMLSEALIDAKRRGINVRVIVDQSSYGLGAVNMHVDNMRSAGVSTRIYHDNIMMHMKMCLIDVPEGGFKNSVASALDFGESKLPANGLTVTGSMNWSREAVTSNQEMFIVTSNKNICQDSKNYFEVMWANSEGTRM